MEGIAKAKAKGVYKGRKPTVRAKADKVRALASDGISKPDIAKRLKISRASVYESWRLRGPAGPYSGSQGHRGRTAFRAG